MGSREEMLARIRAALGPGGDAGEASSGAAAGYRTDGDLAGPELTGLLAERLRDYGSNVRRCRESELPAAIAAALAERGARRVVLPPGLEPAVTLDGAEVVVDDGHSAQALDGFDAVVTSAALAIAETGTIVLDGSPGQGRRALSLIPDYHLCILRASQVVDLVPEAVAQLTPHRPLTWISGPSATSDIELDRVQGVHGPRTLEVIVVTDEV